ncbi:MAG: hypothetical protein R6X14_02525, partial [bacterium]
QPVGSYQTIAFTALAGDEQPGNDTVMNELEVLYPERHDVGATMILAPVGQVDSGTVVTPRAIVHNFGTRAETFPVTFRVGSVYDQTVPGVSLQPGATDTVSFPTWVAQPVGSYQTIAFTALGGDEQPDNDTVMNELEVLYPERHDVGATAILSPLGTLEPGTVVTPRAVVRNFGTRPATFPVTLSIGTAYNQTLDDVRLMPDETDTLSFPDWTAQQVGNHQVLAFTALANDRDRSNDTARAQVTVELLSDVGTETVLAPVGVRRLGEGIVRTVVTPKARIMNYGQQAERSFTVRLRIESLRVRPDTAVIGLVTEQFVTVSELAAGAVTELTFDDVEIGFGNYAVGCSTMLEADQRTENDAGSEHFLVASSAASDRDGRFTAMVYTRAGERIRKIEQDILAGDPLLVHWDGLNDRGEVTSPGVYVCFLRFDPTGGTSESQTTKLLVTSNFGGMVLTWR